MRWNKRRLKCSNNRDIHLPEAYQVQMTHGVQGILLNQMNVESLAHLQCLT